MDGAKYSEWTIVDGPGERMRYSTEASNLRGRGGEKVIDCLDCREPVRGWLQHANDDLEITHWTAECKKCGAFYTVFND